PHTSMNLYSRPGSHRRLISAASARALAASRYSSTKRMGGPSVYARFLQRIELVVIRLPHVAEEVQHRLGFFFIYFGQCKTDVDEHPLPDRRWFAQQADVDVPPHPADVHLGDVVPIGRNLDDLTRNCQTHLPDPVPTRALQSQHGHLPQRVVERGLRFLD